MTSRAWIALGISILALQALILYLFGQPAICDCGYVKLWEGVVISSGNSQHLTDWYTFSHVIHGILFFLALTYFFPRLPLLARLAIAIGVEAAWEVLENTPMVIEHYRQQALAAGYVGDTILNSVSDTVMMAAGFLFAYRVPLWMSIALCVLFELFVLYMIRDNLTLNVLNLVYPTEFLGSWQAGQ